MDITSRQNEEHHGYAWGGLMVFSGTFSTILMKMQYSVRSEGLELCVDPDTDNMTTLCPFNKPWFGVLEMKIAMAMCLVFLFLRKKWKHRSYLETPIIPKYKVNRSKQRDTPRLSEKEALLRKKTPPLSTGGTYEISSRTILILALPSALDLFQTVLGNIGLIWISSSVYQMARGSMIVFSAVLSVQYMNKKLYRYHYFSLFLVCVSVVLVGMSDVPTSTGSTQPANVFDRLIGLLFIVLAQLLTALQIVIEEHVLTTMHVPPVMLVGYEGVWGLAMYIVLAPLLSLTPAGDSAVARIWHEDFVDSFVKMTNSPQLMGLILLYIVAVGTLNVTANNVTKYLNAIVRSILEAVRTLGVWIAGLFMYYVFHWQSTGTPGEAWTPYSWLELLGFVIMVYGTMAYKKFVRFPFSSLYQEDPSVQKSFYQSPYMSSLHK